MRTVRTPCRLRPTALSGVEVSWLAGYDSSSGDYRLKTVEVWADGDCSGWAAKVEISPAAVSVPFI